MSAQPAIDPDQFVSVVHPALAANDLQGLVSLVNLRWTASQIIPLLRGPHEDARKVAAMCLTLIGTRKCIPELAKLLQDDCPCVNRVAEHAMWSIWFRAGTCDANRELARGAGLLERRDTRGAIRYFDNAIKLCPTFPEPYNQRAIAYCLLENFDRSLADCRRAVELMPEHFGAWAGMGHNHMHMGNHVLAIQSYDRALAINPHLHAIREAVVGLRARLCHPCDDSSVH